MKVVLLLIASVCLCFPIPISAQQTNGLIYKGTLPSDPPPKPIVQPLQYDFLSTQQQDMRTIENDINNFELEKKHKQEFLNDASKEFGPDIRYKFPSHLNQPGAEYYKIAFDTLFQMLNGRRVMKLKKAIFAPEWAFYESALNYREFEKSIKDASNLIALKMKQDHLPNTSLAKNYAIFKFFSDTIKIKLPGPEKRTVTHYPLRYDFEDAFAERDWSKGMVSKLLQYQTGQCHSMPLLYLLIADELGSTAYLTNAPEHTYIKIPLANGKFQNLELTNGHMTTDSYVLSSGYIKAEALASKIYMKPLTKKETIAQSMIDLAKGYRNKYGFDDFYLNTVQTALLYQPNNVNGIYMIASYYYWLYLYVEEQNPAMVNTPKEKLSVETQQIIDNLKYYDDKLKKLGYEEMPKEIYAEWLKSADKENQLSKRSVNAIQESLSYKKK